ncbi:MAG: hypothetical protein LBD13_06250 [Spirochaetaceae bacterium]|jgi:hypothetical protein|nr:hypothetical protein [Spirochaetaceae bacterium]
MRKRQDWFQRAHTGAPVIKAHLWGISNNFAREFRQCMIEAQDTRHTAPRVFEGIYADC